MVELHVDQSRSYWVIYYFDTPALEIKHQLFNRVIYQFGNQENKLKNTLFYLYIAVRSRIK
jgi:hypothetical protein